MTLTDLPTSAGPATRALTADIGRLWPEHERFLRQRFADNDDDSLAVSEQMAARISRILGDRRAEAIANYRWTCELMLEEEYAFRCTGNYRYSSFEEVRARVYDDPDFMGRYADGLLLSQLLWANHTAAITSYCRDFLDRLNPDADLLEVGPGHGLLLALAAERLTGAVTGWDVSETSLAVTRRALVMMGIDAATLEHVDLLAVSPTRQFDAVVASELLEHLEDPVAALDRLRAVTRPGGQLFLNIPVNSPAPDHIYLWRTPEDVVAFVAAAGLEILSSQAFPMTGKSVAQARAADLTMSCVVICRCPEENALGVHGD